MSMQTDLATKAPPHPAQYTPALLPIMARYLGNCARILDPFGGCGGVFRLAAWLPMAHFEAVEIEPEWAAVDPRITLGNALALPWPAGYFDAVATSPAYGNRMADHHEARDGSRRHTYRHTLGRPLSSHNAGALQWGDDYRQFHRQAWAEARRVLRPGGVFVLNCKDHIRAGKLQPVTDWHISELQRQGFVLVDRVQVACPGQRYGANHDKRMDYETVAVLRLDTMQQTDTIDALTHFDTMHQAIVVAHDLDEVTGIRNQAEALRQYAKQSRLSIEDINRLVEIKLRAERRAGELLGELDRAQGQRSDLPAATSAQPEPKLTLKKQVEAAGLSMPQAKRWQMLSELPAPVFEQHIAEIKDAGNELSTGAILRVVQGYRRDANRARMAEPGAFPAGQFRIIYADPPWQYGDSGVKSEADNYAAVERHYPTMSLDEICALSSAGRRVVDLATNDAVLFLWRTAALLPEAMAVVKAWGFTYKTEIIWHKLRHNFGNYTSVRHEALIVATRGSCLPDIDQKLPSVVEIRQTGEHSAKPEQFREMIDTLYPHGPRLELFRRGAAPQGWHVWGNEAEA